MDPRRRLPKVSTLSWVQHNVYVVLPYMEQENLNRPPTPGVISLSWLQHCPTTNKQHGDDAQRYLGLLLKVGRNFKIPIQY